MSVVYHCANKWMSEQACVPAALVVLAEPTDPRLVVSLLREAIWTEARSPWTSALMCRQTGNPTEATLRIKYRNIVFECLFLWNH